MSEPYEGGMVIFADQSFPGFAFLLDWWLVSLAGTDLHQPRTAGSELNTRAKTLTPTLQDQTVDSHPTLRTQKRGGMKTGTCSKPLKACEVELDSDLTTFKVLLDAEHLLGY